jgi:hypothetical protein
MAWIKHDQTFRQQYLLTLLQHVRLPFLSVRFITDVCDNEVLREKLFLYFISLKNLILLAIVKIIT